MSKYFLILTVFVIASCGQPASQSKKKPTVDYKPSTAEDYSKNIAEVDAQTDLLVPENADSALELVYVLEIDKAVLSMMGVMQGEMQKVALTANPDTDVVELQRLQKYALEETQNLMPGLLEEFAELYRDTLTEQELEDTLKFFKSESGRAYVGKQAQLMIGGTKIGEGLDERLLGRLTKRLQAEKIKEARSE